MCTRKPSKPIMCTFGQREIRKDGCLLSCIPVPVIVCLQRSSCAEFVQYLCRADSKNNPKLPFPAPTHPSVYNGYDYGLLPTTDLHLENSARPLRYNLGLNTCNPISALNLGCFEDDMQDS